MNQEKSSNDMANRQVLYLSIGENCLTDAILKRHGLKSFSTPYSHSRSNIDYVIEIEQNDYCNLLCPDSLYYANEQGIPLNAVRSKSIIKCEDIYSSAHQKGFEFTHHDVISDPKSINSYMRKIERMRQLRKQNQPVCFFYHHRYNDKMNPEKIISKIFKFLEFYNKTDVKRAVAVVFFQRIDTNNKFLEHFDMGNGILVFKLHTPQVWAGKDENIFFAKNDDDLISEMFDLTKKFVNKHLKKET